VHDRGEYGEYSYYFYLRPHGLDIAADTSNEATTTNSDINGFDSLNLFQNFFPDSSLTSNYN
jgi:hypothetical protein